VKLYEVTKKCMLEMEFLRDYLQGLLMDSGIQWRPCDFGRSSQDKTMTLILHIERL